MKTFLVLFLCLPLFADCLKDNTEDCGEREGRQYSKAINDLKSLAEKSDTALDSMIRVAVVNLRATNEFAMADADQLEYEWNTTYKGYLSRHYRDIGDHSPLLSWLAKWYDIIEASLGVQTCKALHLSDIKTLNFAIPVVFKPCTFPMDAITIPREDEYRKHFAMGDVYYGLTPVIGYWAITIACWGGTSGAGSFLCTIAATGAEYALGHWIAPHLSDFIYERVCP